VRNGRIETHRFVRLAWQIAVVAGKFAAFTDKSARGAQTAPSSTAGATAPRRAGSAASQTQRGDNFSLDMILMTDA
jgi:hypothetical protein